MGNGCARDSESEVEEFEEDYDGEGVVALASVASVAERHRCVSLKKKRKVADLTPADAFKRNVILCPEGHPMNARVAREIGQPKSHPGRKL